MPSPKHESGGLDAVGVAVRAESRRYMRQMAASGRGWDALLENVKPMGIDIQRYGRPRIIAVQGEHVR